MKYILSAFCILTIHLQLNAGGCAVVKKNVVAVQQVVAPVVPVTALQVIVPTYTYQYTPMPQQQYVQPEDCCERLVAELAKLRAELAGLKAGGSSSNATTPLSALLVKQNACAKCHTEGKDPKGDLVLFLADGKEAPLSLEQKKRIARRVTNGSMPPADAHLALTEAERQALLESLK